MSDLCCVLCLFTVDGVAQPAYTVIDGHAVCEDHVNYFQSERLYLAMKALKEGR